MLSLELFMAGISTWVGGYSGGPSGLLVSAVARQGSMNDCSRAIFWVVSWTWPLAVSDGPLSESSFPSLYLGGISQVFSRAHK
jgi:hypothetical protein